MDLQRAYRNLRVEPRDYRLLGLKLRDATYYDVAIPFGLKQGALGCQFSTDAITYLMAPQCHWVMSYLDDVIGASSPGRFLSFMEQFNGSVEMHLRDTYTYEIYVDASLQGLGAKLENMVCAIPILYTLKNVCTIVHFEALNILVGLNCWAKYLAN